MGTTSIAGRSGATLVEVLVAIFVMGLGLIALLTLFPLGVLRMQAALQDQSCSEASANARFVGTFKNVRNDPQVRTPPWLAARNPKPDVFIDLLAGDRQFAADPNGPSYPVYVDPIGYQNAQNNSQSQRWLSATGVGGRGWIARSPTSYGIGTTNAFKWFARLDDYIFDDTEASGGTPIAFATPAAPTPPVIRRDLHYSWAYLVQRPRASDTTLATCSVVIYNKRPLALTGNLGLSEATYNATFNTGTNTISVDWSTGGLSAPNVRAGDWILDATFIRKPKPGGGFYGTNHGFFYRVVGVTETSTTTADFEVQQPIRDFPIQAPRQPVTASGASTSGHIMVLEGIADVFELNLDRKFN